MIALSAAMTPLGAIASAAFIPTLARRVGASRLAIGCAVAIALVVAVIGAVHSVTLWFPARLALGVALNGLFVVGEAWITQRADPTKRGRIVGVYASVFALAFALGPLVLVVTGAHSDIPFVVICIASLVSAGILSCIWRTAPTMAAENKKRRGSLMPFPLLALAVACFALFDQITLSLFPVYGVTAGWSEAAMAVAVSVLNAGSIALQYLIGWFSDRSSRRLAMLLCAGLTTAGAAALPYVVSTNVLWPLLFVWGAVAYGVKTLSLIEMGDRLSGEKLIAGTAGLSLMRGVGGTGGGLLAGVAMDHLGPAGLPVTIGMTFLVLTAAGLASARRVVLERNSP
ncbi:putative MFS family arabinose efflux permease [Bradyrhizobium daqingense]|uniref:Putative MFS family arabinose efflux permease n=2 Tax=Bradyrhizobium daqingense TaxID=993502 RepID=A0A562LTW0_9BRAD|nr:putative MFS family arabinose efflux permease [Bradyrhizobium daqingense]